MRSRRSWKAALCPLLAIVVFFAIEWRFLYSLGGNVNSDHFESSGPVSAKLSHRVPPMMYSRLLGLATHALAEGASKPEPDDLWTEPFKASSAWKPCSERRAINHQGPPEPRRSSGYIVVTADGGLNQQRVAICNAVAVARLLNATLVLPHFMYSSVWRDLSQFEDIYETDYFIDYLRNDVHIVRELPLELRSLNLTVMGSVLTNAQVEKESKPSFFVDRILPLLIRNRVVHFFGFENALASDPIPFELQVPTTADLQMDFLNQVFFFALYWICFQEDDSPQRLRCRCNFHALKFTPHIRNTGGKLIKRMRELHRRWGPTDESLLSPDQQIPTVEQQLLGDMPRNPSQLTDASVNQRSNTTKYLGLHLRFEIDMVAYSLCEFGGGEEERHELTEYRRIHFQTVSKYHAIGKLMSASQLRESGRCPLTPEEGALMLASLGFRRSTRIFLAGAHVYGGRERLTPILSLYPNLVTKEDLLTSEELAPFADHASQLAALDFIGCAAADAFAMTDSGSQLSSLVAGYRIYNGEGKLPTIRPNKRRMAAIFAKNISLEWEEFEEQMRKMVLESKKLLIRPTARSPYRHPRCNECMCSS